MTIRWLNTPCTDPVGRVFTADGNVYRAIFPDREDLARSVIDNAGVRALMDEGLIARMQVCSRKVQGCNLVIETERAPFDVPCDRFTRATLRTATLRWLEISRRLLPAGLVLSDAHFGNYMLFGRNEPRWIDLGSIRPPSAVEEEKPFRSCERFWSGMLAPLVLMETQPRYARLARLSIGDHPYQGPLTTPDEPPLSATPLTGDIRERIFSEIRMLDAEQALDRLSTFTSRLPVGSLPPAARGEKPDTAIAKFLEKQFTLAGIASVVCLGADARQQLGQTERKIDMLVIDEREGELDALAKDPQIAGTGARLALYYGHPVNRMFLKNPPAADAVFAIDPLTRYAHSSHVETENISHVLASLGRKLAVVVTAAAQRERTERMLRQEYPSVVTETFSWLGRGPVVVTGKKTEN